MRQKINSLETKVTNPQSTPQVGEHQIKGSRITNHTQIKRLTDLQPLREDTSLHNKTTVVMQATFMNRQGNQQVPNKHFTSAQKDSNLSLNQKEADTRKHLRDKELEINKPRKRQQENSIQRAKISRGRVDIKLLDTKAEEDDVYNRAKKRVTMYGDKDSLWEPAGDLEGTEDEDLTPAPVFDTEVNWSQTFQVSNMDLQALRSDWIDLRCNVSGNLLLHSSDALPIVKLFMNQLNEKHYG